METPRNITNQTLKEYLRASIESDNAYCKGWEYLKANIPECLQAVIQTEEYEKKFYLSAKVDYILECLQINNLDDEEKSQLRSFTYVQNGIKDANDTKLYKEKMLADGWLPVTENIVRQAKDQGKKLRVSALIPNDFLTPTKIDKIYKPYINGEKCFLMDLKARTRGYGLQQFENAFCKLI